VRILAIVLGVLALAAALLFVGVALMIDQETVARELSQQATRATGAEVSLGETRLSLFPTPTLRARDLRVSSGSHELLTAREVRASVSLLSALLGRIVVTTLEIDAPDVHLALGRDGALLLPEPAAAGDDDDEADSLALAVYRVVIADGSASFGPWRAEHVNLVGSLGLDGEVHLSGALDVRDVAKLTALDAAIASDGTYTLAGELADADLLALLQNLGVDVEVEGIASGPFELAGSGARLDVLRLQFDVANTRYDAGQLAVGGSVRVYAAPGERWRVDLAAADVRLAGAARKPFGAALALSGDPLVSLDPGALTSLSVELEDQQLPIELSFVDAVPVLRVVNAALDLRPFTHWVEDVQAEGRLGIEELEIGFAPLRLTGRGRVDDLLLELPHGQLRATGNWIAHGDTLAFPTVDVDVGGEAFSLSGAYDVARSHLTVSMSAQGVEVEPVVQSVRGHSELTGTLEVNAAFSGPANAQGIQGEGAFEIRDGRLRGFSIIEQMVGQLSASPLLGALLRGSKLSELDDEEFESLSANFHLTDGRVFLQPLVAVYRSGTAHLYGSVGVLAGDLDMHGKIELSEQGDRALTGAVPERATVIPIEGITGTLARPRIEIDAGALAGVASTLAGQSRLGQKLEEALGPDGSGAVQDLLDQLFKPRQDDP